MPLGAHETMEAHEILLEKVNMITHFNLYARQAKNPRLLEMIVRHQQEEIRSYNEFVALTRGNNSFNPIPPNTAIRGISNQDIQYGLNNPPQIAPQADANFSDAEVAIAMLCFHKSAARNSAWAATECADPDLRRFLLNSSANCNNQAYEVFLFMNEQGLYPVPTLNTQSPEAFPYNYQPASGSLQAQYANRTGQNAGYVGYGGQSAYGNAVGTGNAAGTAVGVGAGGGAGSGVGVGTGNAAGTGFGTGNYAYANSFGVDGNTMNGNTNNLSVASRQSVLYGNGGGVASAQYGANAPTSYGNVNAQGTSTR